MNRTPTFRRFISTATAKPYPFASNVTLLPAPVLNPSPALMKGKGLMAELYKRLPSPQTQKLLKELFSRRHPNRLMVGSVVTVNLTHAPTTFSGIVLAIRRRGIASSFVVRNIIQRTGVDMQFFIGSPHLKSINVMQKGKARRAKLYYLRDSPEKMSQISAGLRG